MSGPKIRIAESTRSGSTYFNSSVRSIDACSLASAFASALTSAQEGRGFNAYFPMPFAKQVRIEQTAQRNQRGPNKFIGWGVVDPVKAVQSGDEQASKAHEDPKVALDRVPVVAQPLQYLNARLACSY